MIVKIRSSHLVTVDVYPLKTAVIIKNCCVFLSIVLLKICSHPTQCTVYLYSSTRVCTVMIYNLGVTQKSKSSLLSQVTSSCRLREFLFAIVTSGFKDLNVH